MYDNRAFMIFQVIDLSQINFDEVLETSSDTVRRSIDGLKAFVKWEGPQIPPSVNALVTKEGPYNYHQMLEILATSEWKDPNPPL